MALLALLVVGLAPAVRAGTEPAAVADPVAFSDADGIHVVAQQQLDPRQYNVSVLSPALGRPVNVRILVPAAYSSTPSTRYPVLYLFHGTSGRASDWVTMGGAEPTTADLPLIVVMPDAGFNGDGGGWFTNWVDTRTALGASQWETFHIDQLIPWVDANLRTIADRDGRAIAGLSQGGFGSTTYAARHPDLFGSVASFSGAPDIDYNPLVAAGATAVIDGTEIGLDGVEPDAMFGSRLTDEINWQGHDPADLATNLRSTNIWLFTATGAPGPYDPKVPNLAASGIEYITHVSTMSFYSRLQALGIPNHLDNYVYGTHSWPYWARDLRQYVGPLMQLFAHPPAAPDRISYESIDQSWTQWGWSVRLQRRPAQQFSGLTGAGAGGFVIDGTGTGSVTTPAFYRAGSVHPVTISGIAPRQVVEATADSSGRLHLTVPLGAGTLLGGLGTARVIIGAEL